MFYLIEKQEQLQCLEPMGDCYVDFIPYNDNYHPKLTQLSLIYVRDINQHKGYILCINHNESFSLLQSDVEWWLLNNTERLFVLNKKNALYHFQQHQKLFDVNFIEQPNLSSINIPAISYYYNQYENYVEINRLIPISKHYEKCENTFNATLPIINKYQAENAVYAFNNGPLTRVFHNIESQGINVDKVNFKTHYLENIQHPEFSISKGKIYTQYNLYTTTGRPSNTFNNINFGALSKTNGERSCYITSDDLLVEMDIHAYHPHIVGEMIGFDFPKDVNVYEYLGKLLNVTTTEAKTLTFKQINGGVWKEYKNKPFFKDIQKLTEKIWKQYTKDGYYKTPNQRFTFDPDMTQSKLLNYIIQSTETYKNVIMLEKILDYLRDKQTKIVLYTYDAYLISYNKNDGKQLLTNIQNMIEYPINIKQGESYQGMDKI